MIVDADKLQDARHSLIVGMSTFGEFLASVANGLRTGAQTPLEAADVLDEVAQYARATVRDMSA